MEAISEYSLSGGEECFGYKETSTSTSRSMKKIVKRRFSDEQIRSLEGVFENETRLEPRKKVEVAKKLGLEPRQVAIWFQNKRARYKSKQLEHDYKLLRAKYNDLASRFDNLNRDKQTLLIQLQKLNDLMEKSEGGGLGQCCRQVNSIDGESDNGDEGDKLEFEEMIRSEQGIGIDDNSKKADYFGEANLVELVEAADSCLTISSAEDWSSFDFNQSSSTSYQWWDFWS